jgi:hypothetical protein
MINFLLHQTHYILWTTTALNDLLLIMIFSKYCDWMDKNWMKDGYTIDESR